MSEEKEGHPEVPPDDDEPHRLAKMTMAEREMLERMAAAAAEEATEQLPDVPPDYDEPHRHTKMTMAEREMLERMGAAAAASAADESTGELPDVPPDDDEPHRLTKMTMAEREMIERMRRISEQEGGGDSYEAGGKAVYQSSAIQTERPTVQVLTPTKSMQAWEMERKYVESPDFLEAAVLGLYHYYDRDILSMVREITKMVDGAHCFQHPDRKDAVVVQSLYHMQLRSAEKKAKAEATRKHRMESKLAQEHTRRLERLRVVFDRLDEMRTGMVRLKDLLSALKSDPTVWRLLRLVPGSSGTSSIFVDKLITAIQATLRSGRVHMGWQELEACASDILWRKGILFMSPPRPHPLIGGAACLRSVSPPRPSPKRPLQP